MSARRDTPGAHHVQPRPPCRAVVRQQPQSEESRDQADRHVDQEDDAPAEPENVHGQQRTTQHLTGHRTDAHSDRDDRGVVDRERGVQQGRAFLGCDGPEPFARDPPVVRGADLDNLNPEHRHASDPRYTRGISNLVPFGDTSG
jgi:hypothetical protein